MGEIFAVLKQNLDAVEARMSAACRRAGRERREVTLVAVTKTVSAEVAALLPGLGVRHLGESRPQELLHKAAALPGDIEWHLIGHLQRNKVQATLPRVHWIHSVDSLRLLAALEQEASRQNRSIAVLLEFNILGDSARHGFAPEEVRGLVPQLGALRHVRVQGLMTMAAFEEDPQRCRPTFAALRGLRDQLRACVGGGCELRDLSMGMSNDFEIAVEEGATLIRLGTVLFEGLEKKSD